MEIIYTKKQDYKNYIVLKELKNKIAQSEDKVVFVDKNFINEISTTLGLTPFAVDRIIKKYAQGLENAEQTL